MRREMLFCGRGVIAGIAVAAVLWFVMFSPWTAPKVDFWCMMTVSAVTLTCVSGLLCPELFKELRFGSKQVACGLAMAFVLWCVFWVGGKVSQMLFGFARPQIDMIYSMGEGTAPAVIAFLLLLVIGPAEEIFWRGFVQRRLMQRLGPNAGFLVATACYALVHVWSFNFMLIMAALVVGFCWGAVYRFFPRSLAALVVSHAVWDACAFVLFTF